MAPREMRHHPRYDPAERNTLYGIVREFGPRATTTTR
jgi:hypothetical protein